MQEYWLAALSLAQQQLYLDPQLEAVVQGKLSLQHDPALQELLDILDDVHWRQSFNPYHQAQRDRYAVENGLFDHITGSDIVLALDKDNNVIFVELQDAFQNLLKKYLEHRIAEAFAVYSILHPVPLPDLTRHGTHWVDWLIKRPELDFRNPGNEQNAAVSGQYHDGVGAVAGDAHGEKGLFQKPDSEARIENWPHVRDQKEKLRYGALGACTEILTFLFQLMDPELCLEYQDIALKLAEHHEATTGKKNLFETRRSGDLFTMRALLINVMTTDHIDTHDWKCGFAGLVAVGDYEGGDLLLRQLGLRIEARQGAAQLMRGRELRHSIQEYEGTRFCNVFVTSEAVKQWVEDNLSDEQ